MKSPSLLCFCSKYKGKKHQLGRGACTGEEFTQSIYIFEQEVCASCHCNNNNYCEVAEGLEDIKECQVYQNWINYDIYPEYWHPMTEKKYHRIQEEKYQDYYSSRWRSFFFFFFAEDEGFEPSVRRRRTTDFESVPLNLSGNLPKRIITYFIRKLIFYYILYITVAKDILCDINNNTTLFSYSKIIAGKWSKF